MNFIEIYKGGKIEWKSTSWNPTTGCSKISAGCRNCYAERYALRHQQNGMPKYRDGFAVRLHQQYLHLPLSWKSPHNVFVNSMSDLFHPEVSDEFITKVFQVMNNCPQHCFFIITKRTSRALEIADYFEWSANIWLGVSIENNDNLFRKDHLLQLPAHVKFINFEPLLEKIDDINLSGIDYVTVGGETGPGARKMLKSWTLDIERQCIEQDVPFFFKRWSRKSKFRKEITPPKQNKSSQLQLTFD